VRSTWSLSRWRPSTVRLTAALGPSAHKVKHRMTFMYLCKSCQSAWRSRECCLSRRTAVSNRYSQYGRFVGTLQVSAHQDALEARVKRRESSQGQSWVGLRTAIGDCVRKEAPDGLHGRAAAAVQAMHNFVRVKTGTPSSLNICATVLFPMPGRRTEHNEHSVPGQRWRSWVAWGRTSSLGGVKGA